MNHPQHPRRRALIGAVAAASLLPFGAAAQSAWPRSRPIRIIDPSQAGSSTDVVSRMISIKLSARLGQSVIVENKPGAGTTIGVDAASKSAPDGYTFLLISPAVCTNAATAKSLPFDYLKDIVPVGEVAVTPVIIVVPADSPFKTLRDLIESARAKPGSVHYASAGPGSMSHIGMELLGMTGNVQLTHVPYKGAALAIPDMMSGQVQAALTTLPTFAGAIDAGKVRPLVVASSKRSPVLPNVQTTTEAGLPDFIIEYWFGLAAPSGTPPEVIARVNKELNAIAAEPATRDYLVRLAAVPRSGTQEEFAKLNAAEVGRWSRLMKERKVKVD